MPVLMGGRSRRAGLRAALADFHIDQSTLLIDDGICLTATIEILRAIAAGNGPANAVLALGYAGWQAASSRARSRRMAGCTARPIRS